MIFLLVIAAKIMAMALAYYDYPTIMARFAEKIGSPSLLFVAICMLYLVLGCFFDVLSMIFLTLPFLIPMIKTAGFDMIWFGVIVVVLAEIALVTPPVGLNLFVLQGVTREPLETITKGCLPFLVIMCLLIAILAAFPQIALWLPTQMKG